MNHPTFHAADLGLPRRDWEESAFYMECDAAPESERRIAESACDGTWLRRRTGNGRSSRRRCRRGAGSRSRGGRILLELQAWGPVATIRRLGTHGTVSHRSTALRAYRHANEVLVTAFGTNGACHVNSRWSKAHCLVLSTGFSEDSCMRVQTHALDVQRLGSVHVAQGLSVKAVLAEADGVVPGFESL